MTETTLNRDCPAVLIPSGEETILPTGTEAIVTQCLDNTLTIATRVGLARIAGAEADALGSDYETIEKDLREGNAKRKRSVSGLAAGDTRATESQENRDEDRVNCPFCEHVLYPGSDSAAEQEWCWEGDVCEHTLFLAIDVAAFSGFEYRSKMFNHLLGLPDSDDAEIHIPCPEDPDDFLSVEDIIQKLRAEVPDLELRSYDEEGGMACGPVPGGTITFGLVPVSTNKSE